MAQTAEELYETAKSRLEVRWAKLGGPSPGLSDELAIEIASVVKGRGIAQRYAVVTQLLLKLVLPQVDCRSLKDFDGGPSGVSSRSLAKRVVVPFDLDNGAPLGGSSDPYVSNPLRRAALDETVAAGADAAQWTALLSVLNEVEENPQLAESAFGAALVAMRERQHDLKSLIARVLELQAGSLDAARLSERKELVEKVAPLVLKPILPEGVEAEGSGGAGTPAEVPWVRFFSRAHSPSAQQGWYVACLFSADGGSMFICLMQGVTAASALEVEVQAGAIRERFEGRGEYETEIDLKSSQQNGRPELYERATALAKRYSAASLPPLKQLEADVVEMSGLLGELYAGEAEGHLNDDFAALTVEAVLVEAANAGIEIDAKLARAAVAALQAGQHLLLTGPPGTGKTSLAVALCRAAAAVRLCTGFSLVTGTADWTSAETIGAYWPDAEDQALEFQAGPILRAIDSRAWLVIDELNRADIDKALGPLFTVLSGHAARLPQHEAIEGRHLPVEILAPGGIAAGDTAAHTVAQQWRLIATLNTRDRDLLFNLSYALLRRFAVVDVPIPGEEQYRELLKAKAASGSAEVDERLLKLALLPQRPLGPAILIDCATFLRRRLVLSADDEEIPEMLSEALAAFVLPQLDDLSRIQQVDAMLYLHTNVLGGMSIHGVAALLATTFQAKAEDLVADVNVEKPHGGGENAG